MGMAVPLRGKVSEGTEGARKAHILLDAALLS